MSKKYQHKPEPETELGRSMQAWRKQLGLTPQEFAERFKIKLSTISAIENGTRHSIPDDLIGPLANALNLKPSAFKDYVGRKERATDSKFGQLIRTRRKELGLSQIRLAEKLQIKNRQFLSQIELGQCPLNESNAMVERLAAVLELNLSDLQAVRTKPRKSLLKKARSTPLGQFLTTRRLELGLSQRELAERIGIWPNEISVVEIGKFYPGPDLLSRYSKALECQIPAELMPSPRKRGRPKAIKSVRFSKQSFKKLNLNLRKIKEISGIKDDDSEAINKALELLRQLLEKSI